MSSPSPTKPHLPMTRINMIMKSSSDADKISKESTLLMAKATELFIKLLAQSGYKMAGSGKKLDYRHLAQVVNDDERYEFVKDIMPMKITVAEFKKILAREKKRKSEADSEEDEAEESEDVSEESSTTSSSSTEDSGTE